ncbi:heme lyase CcmF/NrfE family subunit [Psychrosphaera sp. F3M07]|uniref:Heme lyase CcmF/NrfE family subunit n=1 Tax=Psychrosphaera aquimarina TaxID=2044854 RepID=A0ABU3R4P0_9GAMM|nr:MULTISPECIES: heme lyase CcmF/NrfE family subunit [Psychrosphaera]MBU2916431.1 heme lyase CcmF/NrfE family subunit [Psychrosphaera sp. F3M07]MDU0114618.1 heme lyase CcmF/NrfE family subunit [Psychrosphaera aquimarina]
MIPELGNFALYIAFALSILLSIFPAIGVRQNNARLMAMAPNLSIGLFVFTLFSFSCLVYAFLTDDFTVVNVAQNSNSALPNQYKFAASFGSHEGSFLLWLLMQSGWLFAVAIMSKGLPVDMRTRILTVLGWVCVGFYAYIIISSNPFERTLPYFPVDGRDLNPLLQDIGMIIHPPLLYMGYVGLSVSFAFAIAALLSGNLDSTWAKWSRPWTAAAWAFLTLGITVGSWWAYSELGWGGWWFWDPVENASFMPWLVATALLHSLAVSEKRNAFKSWTVFLAIAAFSLSLLGTFLVRSGVIVSVHAFASDPERGIFILILLALVIGGSLLLYSLRAGNIKSFGKFSIFSRESMLWGNNVLLIAATMVVLMGTLLPLVHKEIGLGTISIGEPFFNQMFTYLIVPFALLLGIAPLVRWKQDKLNNFVTKPVVVIISSVVLTLLWLKVEFNDINLLAALGTCLAVWVVLFTLLELKQTSKKVSLFKLPLSHYSMSLGHIGLAFVIAGVALTSQYSVERDVKMNTGDSAELRGYQFTFDKIKNIEGPNYDGWAAVISVTKQDKPVATMLAEKRFYPVQRNTMTEAAIDDGFFRDIYISLGERLPDGAWALRLYVKPYVRWIWLGGIIVAFAGGLTLFDRRYRNKNVAKVTAQ